MAGDVSIQRGDSDERSAAAVNAPLVTGDVVTTGPGAHAEVQFDSSNMLRLASDSEVRLSEVAGARYQVEVARGTVMFSVVRDSQAQVEVSTPAVS
jgi:ferric-dicitrate binding protein FerR (iron transport regulator)